MIGIYKITNPKNKIYIGQSVNIKRRFKEYKSIKCKRQPRLYNSLKKYGVNNHTFEIIDYCDVEELNSKERYYQELYNCLSRSGLNCRVVTDDFNSGYLSKETIQKLKDKDFSYMIGNNFRTGIPHTDEIKNQIRNTLIENSKKPCYVNGMTGRSGDLNPFFGKKHTKESLKKMSESNSVNDRFYSEDTRRLMSENFTGEGNPYYGKKHTDEIILRMRQNSGQAKKVINIESGVIYNSARETSRVFNLNYQLLVKKLTGKKQNDTNFKYL